MAKIFTITEGLENLGAMKTGGQGSVYKGKRMGEIIAATKLLPTPIFSENPEDKNFSDFQNEVQKLKKVNEELNPHVVAILSSGITESGNFPFIEMEYIEGPDLEDLLKLPHDPIFTIKEVIKIAEQLSNALAHCHKFDVKHGDIKSNNVKCNARTGNYVLLDFGLSIMSDEQRRTSLRQAGAIEFMAPEQNEGHMMFQTDVYSFGIILFELLAGEVPFPLYDKGETARNAVRLSHMETAPPDVLEVRKKMIPEQWPDDKKEREMLVPEWVLSMISKCIQKKPENRFSNGIELHKYIVLNSTLVNNKEETNIDPSVLVNHQVDNLLLENNRLKTEVLKLKKQAEKNYNEIEKLKALQLEGVQENQTFSSTTNKSNEDKGGKMVSRSSFIMLLVLTIGLGAFAAYKLFYNPSKTSLQTKSNTTDSTLLLQKNTSGQTKSNPVKKKVQPVNNKNSRTNVPQNIPVDETNNNDTSENIVDNDNEQTNNLDETSQNRYKVISKAFFHNSPDESTRRAAFINHWNKAVLTPIEEQNGFIYIIYTNSLGQTTKGWLRKKDLIKGR
jgi:serine/threonine-protein kinase